MCLACSGPLVSYLAVPHLAVSEPGAMHYTQYAPYWVLRGVVASPHRPSDVTNAPVPYMIREKGEGGDLLSLFRQEKVVPESYKKKAKTN